VLKRQGSFMFKHEAKKNDATILKTKKLMDLKIKHLILDRLDTLDKESDQNLNKIKEITTIFK